MLATDTGYTKGKRIARSLLVQTLGKEHLSHINILISSTLIRTL